MRQDQHSAMIVSSSFFVFLMLSSILAAVAISHNLKTQHTIVTGYALPFNAVGIKKEVTEPEEKIEKSVPNLDALKVTTVQSRLDEMAAPANNMTIPPRTAQRAVEGTDVNVVYVTERIAAHRYDAVLEDECPLSPGDVVHVIEEYGDGWAAGLNITKGVNGTFPRVCLL